MARVCWFGLGHGPAVGCLYGVMIKDLEGWESNELVRSRYRTKGAALRAASRQLAALAREAARQGALPSFNRKPPRRALRRPSNGGKTAK